MSQGYRRGFFTDRYEGGGTGESEGKIREALEKNPNDRFLKIRLANLYLRKNRLTEARILIEEVLSNDPQHQAALSLLGDLFMKGRDPEKAIDAYRQAYAKRPNDELLLKTARALKQRRRFAEALQELEKVLVVKPNSFAFLKEKALVLLGMKRKAEALEAFEKAKAIRPEDAYVQKEVLRLRGLGKSDEQAIAELRMMATMESRKDDPQFHGLFAERLENAGFLREAAAEYRIASDLRPDNTYFLKREGYCYYHDQDYDQALRCLKEAFRMDPSDFYVRRTIKRIYEIRGELDGFLTFLEEVLKRHPQEKTLYGAINKVRKELERLSPIPGKP